MTATAEEFEKVDDQILRQAKAQIDEVIFRPELPPIPPIKNAVISDDTIMRVRGIEKLLLPFPQYDLKVSHQSLCRQFHSFGRPPEVQVLTDNPA